MTSHLDELKRAGAAYRKARDRAEQTMRVPREELTETVRRAYVAGMRKADILRAIDHVWSRQWLDDTVRDIQPPTDRQTRQRKQGSAPAASE